MSALKLCPQCGTEYPANARFCEVDGTALRSASQGSDLEGSIIADRYLVLKKLGEGGMGQVYLAEHVKMGRKSALKVMHPGMVKDVDAISRFNREAANASRINHPNVAAVYDFGETPEGLIYLAMEYVDGPPLTAVLEQQGALPPKRAAEIARQAADALAVAHDMGIVHRDLKPDNLMLARTRDGGDLVKVVDFGIAKAAGSAAQKVTKTGLVVGTPEYMSPEQLSGDTLDGRSDIYSLALVTFNMLTGCLPFPSDSAQESMIMRLTDKPKPLGEMRPEVAWPADVQAVVDKALERDASRRYQTASEFGRELCRAIDHMPETLAMEVGTQMVGAVPPTRVSEPAGIPPTVAAPASSPVSQRTAPATSKRYGALIGGLAAILLIGVGIPILLKKTGAPAAGQASARTVDPTQAGAQTPNGALPAATGDSTSKGQQVDHLAKKAPKAPEVASVPSGARSVAQILDRLEADAKRDTAAASAVLKRLPQVWPSLKTADDTARGNYIRFHAYLTKKDQDKACTSIAAAIHEVTDSATKQKYQDLRDAGC